MKFTKDDFKATLSWTAAYVLAVVVGLWFRHDIGSLGNYWWETIVYFVFTLVLQKI